MISACNQALIRAEEEEALLVEICDLIVDIGGYRLAWVGFAEYDDQKTVRLAARAGYDEGYLDEIDISWADTDGARTDRHCHPNGQTGNGPICLTSR